MTVVMALLGNKDVVVAVDGLTTSDDGAIRCEQQHKSCKLNARLCLVFAGQSDHMARIMEAIEPSCAGISDLYPVEDWMKMRLIYEGSYKQAKEAAEAEYERLVEEVSFRWKQEREAGTPHRDCQMSGLMLVGEDCGPVIFSMGAKPVGDVLKPTCQEYRHPEQGVTAYSLGLESFPEIARDTACRSLRGELVEAIRDAERKHGEDLQVNGNILIRQLTNDFDEHWELETPTSNSPEQDPSFPPSGLGATI